MAQTHLSQEELKALEQTRRGLYALTNNIASLKGDILRSNPLPQVTSLQTSASILASNVSSLTTHIARHSELFNKTVVYPSTNYPGRTQEGPLNALLRKKLEPSIAAWVEEGREAAINVETGSATEKEQTEFSEWVREFIDQRIQKYAREEAGDNYTAEEREQGIETVNTGLKRKFDEDESDEEDEEMEDVGVTAAPRLLDKSPFKYDNIGLGEVKRNATDKQLNQMLSEDNPVLKRLKIHQVRPEQIANYHRRE